MAFATATIRSDHSTSNELEHDIQPWGWESMRHKDRSMLAERAEQLKKKEEAIQGRIHAGMQQRQKEGAKHKEMWEQRFQTLRRQQGEDTEQQQREWLVETGRWYREMQNARSELVACVTAMDVSELLTPSQSKTIGIQNPPKTDQQEGLDDEEHEGRNENPARSIQIAASPELSDTLAETAQDEMDPQEPSHLDAVSGSSKLTGDAEASLPAPMEGAQELLDGMEPGTFSKRAERRSEFSLPSSPQDFSTPPFDRPRLSGFRSINGRVGHPVAPKVNVYTNPKKKRSRQRQPAKRSQDGPCDLCEGDRGLWKGEDENGRSCWFYYHCPGCASEEFYADNSFVSYVQCPTIDRSLLPEGALTYRFARQNFMYKAPTKSGTTL